jgi:hypothetical protein
MSLQCKRSIVPGLSFLASTTFSSTFTTDFCNTSPPTSYIITSAMSISSEDGGSKESGLSGSPSGAESTPPVDTPASEKELVVETEKLVIVDEKDVGMIPNLKNLYGSKEDEQGRFTW